MLRNKWVAVGLIVIALAVIGFYTVPNLLEKKAGTGAEPAGVAAGAPETGLEEFARPTAGRRQAEVAPAELRPTATHLEQETWLAAFANAERDTTRSPFQRKYEGLGKVFIRSRPSGADIYINGIKMPRITDWLMPVSFPAGRYSLELRKEGYEPYVTDLVVPAGMEDFEEITTINAALRNEPQAGVQAAHMNLLYVKGQPNVRVSMIMYNEGQSWAVIQRLPISAEKKWVVTEGDEIEFTTSPEGEEGEKEVYERIKIIRILPEVVTIRNMLIKLDYDFPIGASWTAPGEGGQS